MGNPMRTKIAATIATLLSAIAVAAYLILPGMWQWSRAETLAHNLGWKHPPATQVETPEPEVDQALIARLAATGDGTEFGPVILTYHDIGHTTDRYAVPPENFAYQMRLLHDAGWTTMTQNDLANWMQGAVLPPRTAMITFDDGATGVWKYAEPILRRYNMNASLFIITGSVGTHAPYYMTWDQIRELAATGRWGMEAHTHDGHRRIPSGPAGETEAFMTAKQWLAAEQRFETQEEHHARVLFDLTECKRLITEQTGQTPRFFAYPFSAHEDDPADSDKEVQNIVLSLYMIGMLDDSESTRMTGPEDLAQGFVRRMDTTADITPERFVQKIEEATTT
jgi:biofilm PGA synthesis lipoprotein PgaB